MGSTNRYAYNDESPVTRVRLTRGFWMGKYEVTQDQWQSVMGNNPSHFTNCGGDCPVEEVSWIDTQNFIERLNARSGGGKYRLPTEAEWEYAARAGTTTDTYAGDITQPTGDDPVVNRIGWYRENSGGSTHPVGEKEPNTFGLHDMLGNVLGVGGGLVRALSGRGGDGSCRSCVRLEAGGSRRRLGPQRQALPVGGSRRGLARHAWRQPGLPPGAGRRRQWDRPGRLVLGGFRVLRGRLAAIGL